MKTEIWCEWPENLNLAAVVKRIPKNKEDGGKVVARVILNVEGIIFTYHLSSLSTMINRH